MALTYDVIIRTTEPEIPSNINAFWVNPAVSSLYIAGGTWMHILDDDAIAVYVAGTYTRTMAEQTSAPTGTIGLLWKNPNTNQIWVYLNSWQAYIGG